MRILSLVALTALTGMLLQVCEAGAVSLVVAKEGSNVFHSVQAAVDALPAEGGEIRIAPGIYREKIIVKKSGVRIVGSGKVPSDTVLVYDDPAVVKGGGYRSATLASFGDDFHLENLTVQNDYSTDPTRPWSQAVALAVMGDRTVVTHARMIGAQDTLFANRVSSNGKVARQYFSDCYIEGHVDFIFGDAKAYFYHCEIHGIAHEEVMYTAQSKGSSEQDSAYVFDRCTLTADAKAQNISLGRAWRPYATVIFLNTDMQAAVIPAGWREWDIGKTGTLEHAYYAEYNSKGPGANPSLRDPHSHQLTAEQAAAWSLKSFFASDLGWLPSHALSAFSGEESN